MREAVNERKGRIRQKGISNIGNWLKYFRFKSKKDIEFDEMSEMISNAFKANIIIKKV